MAGEAREKCAVVGVFLNAEAEVSASELARNSLFALQHRGGEASGIASQLDNGSVETRRELGMVRDVYEAADMQRLVGNLAVGHNLYSTYGGGPGDWHPQPFKDRWLGYAFSHNGNLPVTRFLETHLGKHGFKTARANDSELMGLDIAQNIRSGHDLPDAVELSYPLFRGAFSCVAMHDDTLVAFRDSKGIRPLAIGKLANGLMVASETCGLDIVGAEYLREVEPGEMVIITRAGMESRQIDSGERKLDMFEFVYFARHDSMLYGQRVNEVRRRFGEELAEQHPPITDDQDNIVVVPVPDTSVPAAIGYAAKLGLKHDQGIVKNRYIGRTFMGQDDATRNGELSLKHNVIPEAVADKDVILIDDSIVRLNTLPGLITQLKRAGAKSVTVLIASPPVRFPDFYGIDTPKQSDLAAANMTVEEMRVKMGAEYLGYLSLERTVKATGLSAEMFNLSCFNGEYPIGIGHHKNDIKAPVSMEFVH